MRCQYIAGNPGPTDACKCHRETTEWDAERQRVNVRPYCAPHLALCYPVDLEYHEGATMLLLAAVQRKSMSNGRRA